MQDGRKKKKKTAQRRRSSRARARNRRPRARSATRRTDEPTGGGDAVAHAHADPQAGRDADAHAGPHRDARPDQYPARTGVDLSEWTIRPTYRTLATGRVSFNAANLGEDDHNLSVRSGATEYGKVDLAPGDTDSLVLQLPPGTYTLYCSLQGHEEQGMRADIIVR